MTINPQRLRRLREEKRLSRKRLAKLSHVSARQIQRLENPDETSRAVRDSTLDRLARSLSVDPKVLTGELPVPRSAWTYPYPRKLRVNVGLSSEAVLAYDLVERRYGIKARAIMNMAPLFFVLLAEGSLSWRRQELASIRDALAQVSRLGAGSSRKRFARHAGLAEDDSGYEEEAIRNRNLLNDPFPHDYKFEPDESETARPFEEYLQKLVDELEVSGVEVGQGFARSPIWDSMPAYSVCKDELEAIAPLPDAGALYFALQFGDVRLSDIPEHLARDSEASERNRWAQGKMSEETTAWLREQHRQLAEIRDELGLVDANGSEGGKT